MIPKIMEATRLLRVRLEKIADDTVEQCRGESSGCSRTSGPRRSGSTTPPTACSPRAGNPAKPTERVVLCRKALHEVDDRIRDVTPDTLEAEGLAHREEAGCPRPFHWALEFPEVFLDRGGFDAFVGNPPFMGGQKITGNLGSRLPGLPRRAPGPRQAGKCRPVRLLLPPGGRVAARGRSVRLAGNEHHRPRRHPRGRSRPTDGQRLRHPPGRPEPQVAGRRRASKSPTSGCGKAAGRRHLCSMTSPRPGITSFLTEPGAVTGQPHRLAANAGKSFQGSIVLGMGFVLAPDEAQRLIDKNPRNKDVLFPYLNGEDLNSRPDQSPSRGSSTSSTGRSTGNRPPTTTRGRWRRITRIAWRSSRRR